MSFPRYPTYKPSGVEWLGEVPEHWKVTPLKRVAVIQTGLAKGKEVEPEGSVEVPFLRVANVQDDFLDLENVHMITIQESSLSRYLLRPGDVLMNEGGDFDKLGRGCVWDGVINPCIHQNHVFAVRSHSIRPSWLNAYTSSKQANSYFIGRSKQSTNLASISSSNLMDLLVPIAPNSETEEILSFLDRETAKIDALIAEQQRLIELLQEKRQAVISHAVTKGLNPHAPMKGSGVEWLGEVPEHWSTAQIRRLVTLQRGHDITKDAQSSGSVPVVSSGGISSYHSESIADPPAVVIGRKGTAGSLFFIDEPFWPHDTTLYSVDFHGNNPKYVFYCLQAVDLPSFDTGSSNPTINRNRLHPYKVAIPPHSEQLDIVKMLDLEADRFDSIRGEVHHMVNVLKERRSALISAAVTGQIDVRGLATKEEP